MQELAELIAETGDDKLQNTYLNALESEKQNTERELAIIVQIAVKYERVCNAFLGAYERLERNDLVGDGEKELYEEIQLMFSRQELMKVAAKKKSFTEQIIKNCSAERSAKNSSKYWRGWAIKNPNQAGR